MSAPASEISPPASASYRLLLWVILASATILDTILVVAIAHAHGALFWWWLIQKSQADPLIAFLLIELLLLRLGLFILAMRLLEIGRMRAFAAWLLPVPLVGAPVLLAALIATEEN